MPWDGINFADLTAPALLGITVLLILTGRLVPVSSLNRVIKEKDKWQEVAETEREIRVTSVAQSAELLEYAKTTNSIIVAMFGTTGRLRESGESSVVPTSTAK